MTKSCQIAMALVGLGLMASQARAAPIIFVGEDLQPNPGATVRTNADAAAAAFRTAALAIGPVGTITFESAPLGAFSNLAVALGVTVNGTDLNGSAQTIRNVTNFPTAPSLDGSNTTSGGSLFVEVFGGTLTFTFATPTQFFGAYLTGVQTNFFSDSITFNDGTTQTITLLGTGTTSSRGEIAFLGFVDAGKSITSITINAGAPSTGQDAIGVDDVSFQLRGALSIPEPSSLIVCAICAPALWYARRRRRVREGQGDCTNQQLS